VESVTEQEIADAKAIIGRDGIGCEPAGAVTVAGIKKMRASGAMHKEEDVIAIVTGHALKDPDYTVSYHEGTLPIAFLPQFANRVVKVEANESAILEALKKQ